MKTHSHPLLSRRGALRSALAAALAARLAAPASAQEFRPRKPVTMFCPYPPGGLGDATARTLSKGLAELWKVPVVIDTKAGASGMIAAAAVAKGPADGSLLLCMLPEALSVARALKAPVGFDVSADLAPVHLSVISGCLIAVNAKGRFQTYQDLVKYARDQPGKLNFGMQGTGSAFHLAMERWATAENIRITGIPYKGGAPIVTDLLGGQLDAMFIATSLGLPYFRGDQLRPLAVAGKDRIEELQGVRTVAELGLADFEVPITLGVFAPGATDPALVRALNADMRKVMADPESRAWMKRSVVTTPDLTPEAFRARMAREIQVFTEVAARTHIKLE